MRTGLWLLLVRDSPCAADGVIYPLTLTPFDVARGFAGYIVWSVAVVRLEPRIGLDHFPRRGGYL